MQRLPALLVTGILVGLVVVALQIKIIFGQNQNTSNQDYPPVKIIDNFPQVPIYPGAVLSQSTCNDVQSMLFRTDWTVEGVPVQIMNWYKVELQKSGWQIDVPPGDLPQLQYAEFTRGLLNSWLGRLQLSVETQPDTSLVKVEIAFPAPDSEKEAE